MRVRAGVLKGAYEWRNLVSIKLAYVVYAQACEAACSVVFAIAHLCLTLYKVKVFFDACHLMSSKYDLVIARCCLVM